jgi:hypothetical protein
MKPTILVAGLALVAAMTQARFEAQEAAPSMTVYKSPTCGCCGKWVTIMREQGFDVKTMNVDDMSQIKATYGVAPELGSCHTALVGGYVVEGHVPVESVKRLLREKPKVAGIAVPGMPVGSPGMEVPSGKKEPFDVIAFQRDGKTSVFAKH